MKLIIRDFRLTQNNMKKRKSTNWKKRHRLTTVEAHYARIASQWPSPWRSLVDYSAPKGIQHLKGAPFVQFDGDGNIIQKGTI